MMWWDRWILIVEDNPGDAWLMSELLKETGTSVKIAVAGDGKEALDIMNRGLDGS